MKCFVNKCWFDMHLFRSIPMAHTRLIYCASIQVHPYQTDLLCFCSGPSPYQNDLLCFCSVHYHTRLICSASVQVHPHTRLIYCAYVQVHPQTRLICSASVRVHPHTRLICSASVQVHPHAGWSLWRSGWPHSCSSLWGIVKTKQLLTHCTVHYCTC